MSPTILLTGATGFLGGAAAVELLRRPDCRLLLLARGDDPARRLRASLERFADPALLEPALARCDVLAGDLTDAAWLGDPRLDGVTHVLHLAANTSFRSVRSVRHANVLGALTLAHRMRRVAGLSRFLYVGTAYVCGAPAPAVVHEDDHPRLDTRHLVEYTASKAEAEWLLERTAPELPLVVARPSVVVGHTRLGCGPSASLFWYYRALDLLRRAPSPPSSRKDVIPVDYAASALVALLLRPALRHRRYHVSAGAGSCVTWEEIAAAFAAAEGRPSGPYQVVDFATLRRERDRFQALGAGDEEHLLQALELYFRFSTSGVEVFDNQRLLGEGIPPPPRFTDYLARCVNLPGGRSVYDQMRDDE